MELFEEIKERYTQQKLAECQEKGASNRESVYLPNIDFVVMQDYNKGELCAYDIVPIVYNQEFSGFKDLRTKKIYPLTTKPRVYKDYKIAYKKLAEDYFRVDSISQLNNFKCAVVNYDILTSMLNFDEWSKLSKETRKTLPLTTMLTSGVHDSKDCFVSDVSILEFCDKIVLNKTEEKTNQALMSKAQY